MCIFKEDEGHYFIKYDCYYGIIISYVVMVSKNYMVYAVWEKHKDSPEWVYVTLSASLTEDKSFHKASPLEEILLCPKIKPRESTQEEVQEIVCLEERKEACQQYKKARNNLSQKEIQGKASKNDHAILRSMLKHEIKYTKYIAKSIKNQGRGPR